MTENNNVHAVKVDLKKVIRSQKNWFIRHIPNFVIYFLKKLIHENEINEAIEKGKNSFGIDFIKGNIEYLNISIETSGTENLPDSGRFIFVGNHSLGGIDVFAALISVYEKFPNIKIIANEILMSVYNVKDMLLPVNVFNKNGQDVKENINKILATENLHLMTFPAAEVSRKYKGIVQDRKWNKSFIKSAVDYKRDVIPILIDAENSKSFYRFARFRELLQIKFPIELILLPNELFKKRNKTIKVIIGKPISYQRFNNYHSESEWAQIVKDEVYQLKKK
jgi:putative hemolysin